MAIGENVYLLSVLFQFWLGLKLILTWLPKLSLIPLYDFQYASNAQLQNRSDYLRCLVEV